MRARAYCLAAAASVAAVVYGLTADDTRALLFGFLAGLAFLGLLHEVRLVRRNLEAVEEMRESRERDWQWPDRDEPRVPDATAVAGEGLKLTAAGRAREVELGLRVVDELHRHRETA